MRSSLLTLAHSSVFSPQITITASAAAMRSRMRSSPPPFASGSEQAATANTAEPRASATSRFRRSPSCARS
jgi:hypothetical protein